MDQAREIEQIESLEISSTKVSTEVLSKSELKNLMTLIWGTKVELIDSQIKPFTNEKLGFLASHFIVQITARDMITNEEKCKNFFVKHKPLTDETLNYILENVGAFEKEIIFYDQLMPLLKKDFVGENWAPEYYLTTNSSMVFDDLRDKGYVMGKKLLNKDELISALSSLARFHASSILAEKKLDRPLNEVFPRAFNLNCFFDVNGMYYKGIAASVDVVVAIAKQYGAEETTVRDICKKYLQILVPSKTKQNVITHGDLWSNNLMFDKELNCLIVDYQLIRYCPMAQDVMFMLYMCSTKEFRRKYEKFLLRHYYNVLCKTLRDNIVNVRVPSWSELVESAEEQRLGVAIFAVYYFPLSFLDGSACAFMNDSSKLLEYIYNNRTEQVFLFMEKNKEFEKRVRGAVEELLDLAKNLDQLPMPC